MHPHFALELYKCIRYLFAYACTLCLHPNTISVPFQAPSQLSKIDRRISARRSVARILQKSCGDPPIEHPSCTHPAVARQIYLAVKICRMIGRCLGQLSHPPPSAGAPPGTARSPAGLRSATRGNLGCNWQKKNP